MSTATGTSVSKAAIAILSIPLSLVAVSKLYEAFFPFPETPYAVLGLPKSLVVYCVVGIVAFLLLVLCLFTIWNSVRGLLAMRGFVSLLLCPAMAYFAYGWCDVPWPLRVSQSIAGTTMFLFGMYVTLSRQQAEDPLPVDRVDGLDPADGRRDR
jgi:hypothetical protein